MRARYYGDMIDLDLLEKGMAYSGLHKSIVIFICTFDAFKKSFYRYTFENVCLEDGELSLGDGTTKIFFNTKGTVGDISDEAKAFLHYIDGQKSEDDFVRRLDDEVEEARKNEKWRREYMTLLMRDQENREEGRAEGLTEGRAEGLTEGRAEGRAEGRHDNQVVTAKTMLADGMDCKTAAKYSGLPLEEVESLKRLQTV